MELDVLIEDDRWTTAGLADLAHEAILVTFQELGVDADLAEVSLLGCDDARICALNNAHREKNTATNVLSWPAEDLAPKTPGARPAPPRADITGTLALGDMALGYETCAREAEMQGKSLSDHVTHLVVHGMLHLLGYDHIADVDATVMEGLERKILGKMGIDDPYKTY